MAAKPKPTTKALVSYQDRLAGLSAQARGSEANVATGQFISCKGGRFSIGGNIVKEDTIDVVVVDFALENHYYTTDFDSENPASPVCFSYGRKEEEMAPHADSEEPQCESCAECPMNKFGTASRGKGKACGNIRRLGLILRDQLDNAGDAEVAFLKIPVTSVKGWAQYVKSLSDNLDLPPLGVVTQIAISPDDKSQFKLSFSAIEKIQDIEDIDVDAVLGALLDRQPKVYEDLTKPYAKNEAREEAAPSGRGAKLTGGRAGVKPAVKPGARR